MDSHLDNELLYLSSLQDSFYNVDWLAEREARTLRGSTDNALTDAIKLFTKNHTHPSFGLQVLPSFLRHAVPDRKLAHYGLRQEYFAPGGLSVGKTSIPYKTPLNLCLTFDGNLIASSGAQTTRDAIIIERLQGVKGKGSELGPIDWSKALVGAWELWAQENRIPYVALITGEQAKHLPGNKLGTAELSLEKATLYHDVSAQERGYAKGIGTPYLVHRKHWVKPIGTNREQVN